MKCYSPKYALLSSILLVFLFSCRTESFLEGFTDGPIPGLRQTLSNAPDSTLSILIVHGIGPTKKLNYGDGLVSRITEILIKEEVNPIKNDIRTYFDVETFKFKEGDVETAVRVYEYPRKGLKNVPISFWNKKLKFYAVHWSFITEPFKDSLFRADLTQLNNIGLDRHKNLYLNHAIKQFIVNQAFSDFLVYLNREEKAKIQRAIMEGIRLMGLNEKGLAQLKEEPFAGKYLNLEPVAESYENLFTDSNCYSTGEGNPHQFVFIGRSFGSKALIDVVNNNIDPENSALIQLREKYVKSVCDITNWMYLMPHQLPLIQLTERNLDPTQRAMVLENSSFQQNEASKIISYNDPHDLLGYYINPEFHRLSNLNINNRVTNVSVNNVEKVGRIKGSNAFFLIGLGRVFGGIINFLTFKYLRDRNRPVRKQNPLDPELKKSLKRLKHNIRDPYGTHEYYPDNPLLIYTMVEGYPFGNTDLSSEFLDSEYKPWVKINLKNLKKDDALKGDYKDDLKFVKKRYKTLYRMGEIDTLIESYQQELKRKE